MKPVEITWVNRAVPSGIPYLNLILLNIFQAIIAVVVASDVLRRDRELDTTAAIYAHPISNAIYVLGKAIGIFMVFLILNAAVLFIAFIFNFIFSDVSVAFKAYIYYPLLITIPTLVYVVGFSFLLMVSIRNQAVVLITMLGYITLVLFFLGSEFYSLLDFLAIKIPLLYSGFVGFGGISKIVILRGIYFSLGLSFLFIAIVFMHRLPQSSSAIVISRLLAVLFILCAVVLGTIHVKRTSEGRILRRRMVELNDSLGEKPQVTLVKNDITIVHLGNEIECEAKLVVRNDGGQPVEQYFLNLNPGLVVTSVSGARGNVTFERKLHILSIIPSIPISPESIDSLIVRYSGRINEEACYLDVDEKTRENPFQLGYYNLITIDKRHAFIRPDFLLLTPETLWYPVPGIQYSSLHPEVRPWNFTHFSLKVKTDDKLTAVSQGRSESSNNGEYFFTPEVPLPGISLIIGEYERRSVTVDSVEYILFTRKGHDYFIPYFNDIGDTVSVIIRELKQEYESELELPYLYRRFTLIEVPLQFFSYRRLLWTIFKEYSQPEMILAPEKAFLWRTADTRFLTHDRLKISKFRSLQEMQGWTLKVLLRNHISKQADRSIFSSYFNFPYHLESNRWPAFLPALEMYLAKDVGLYSPYGKRILPHMINYENDANLVLEGSSLAEVLTDPEKREIAPLVLRCKSDYLFTLFEHKVGNESFRECLFEFLEQNRFCTASVERFTEELLSRFQYDFNPHIERWYNSDQLPGFILKDIAVYKVLDVGRTRYQIKFTAYNSEPIEGFFLVSMKHERERSAQRAERSYFLDANQAKEIGFIIDYQPSVMMINTYISQNLPNIWWERFQDIELEEEAEPFDGECILEKTEQLFDSGEIIVDDEDPGFEVSPQPSRSFLQVILQDQKWLNSEKYGAFKFWDPPNDWQRTIDYMSYGKYVRSAYYTAAGKGDKKAIWNVAIKESGFYDIYCYTSAKRYYHFEESEDKKIEGCLYLIHHDDGIDRVTLNLYDSQRGWNYLGRYYISEGLSKVELTNKSGATFVLADAIKWVKR